MTLQSRKRDCSQSYTSLYDDKMNPMDHGGGQFLRPRISYRMGASIIAAALHIDWWRNNHSQIAEHTRIWGHNVMLQSWIRFRNRHYSGDVSVTASMCFLLREDCWISSIWSRFRWWWWLTTPLLHILFWSNNKGNCQRQMLHMSLTTLPSR